MQVVGVIDGIIVEQGILDLEDDKVVSQSFMVMEMLLTTSEEQIL